MPRKRHFMIFKIASHGESRAPFLRPTMKYCFASLRNMKQLHSVPL